MKRMGLSLRWRMGLLFGGIPLILLLPVLFLLGRSYTAACREFSWDRAGYISKQLVIMMENSQFSVPSTEDEEDLHTAFLELLQASGYTGEREYEFIALVDANGSVLVHSDSGRGDVISQRLPNLDMSPVYTRQNPKDASDVILVTQSRFASDKFYFITRPIQHLSADNTRLFVVIAENAALVDRPMTVLLVSVLIMIIIASVLIQIFLNRIILTPLRIITEGAAVIGAGDLEYRIVVRYDDELGYVADSFNAMSGKLLGLVTGLESTVKTRTAILERRNRQLEAVTLVGQEAVQQRDVTSLLDTAVKTISEKFGFFHTAIFILDDEKTWAILRAVSSEGGLRMLQRGHRLRVGQEGIVGNVALTGKPRIALDVGEDAVFFRNPDLQTTRSEMALPLFFEDEVIAVLDVQSEEPAAFSTEDISVLQLLTNQLAIALSNVRSFEVMQLTLEELRNLQIDYGRRGWARLAQHDRPMAYEYDRAVTTPVSPIPIHIDPVIGHPGHQIVMDGETPVVMEALRTGDRVLGYLGLSDPNRVWTEDELSLVRSVGDQIASALDNARLIEDTQRNERQQLLISQILQTASTPDIVPTDILKQIASILSQSLDMGVVIAALPLADLPIIHTHAAVGPEGQQLRFFQEDVALDVPYSDSLKNMSQPTMLSLQPFTINQQDKVRATSLDSESDNSLTAYDLDHTYCVPLTGGRNERRFIGLIPLSNNPMLDRDTRELAQNLATQIAVVMDNLNLSAETQQRTEDLRLLYQSSLILSELLEPADVLRAIAEEGAQLLDADASNLWLFQPETNDLTFSYDHLSNSPGRVGTRLHAGEGLVGQCLAEQKTLSVRDYNAWDGHIENLVSFEYHAALAVPLIGRVGPLGVIVFLARKAGVFGEGEISLADLFSAQAAAALENAQLNQDTQRRAEEFSQLYEAGIDLITILDAEDLLNRAAEWAKRVFSAERAVLYLRDAASDTLLRGQSAISVTYYLNEEQDEETRDELTEIVVASRESLLISDSREHKLLKTSHLVSQGLLSLAGVPLQIGDDVLGAMFINSVELNHYRDRDLGLLEFLATQVSSALQNSIQFQQTERALAVVGRQALYQSNVSQAVALLTERGTDSIQKVLQLMAEAAQAAVALYFDASDWGKGLNWELHSTWITPESPSEFTADPKLQHMEVADNPAWAEMLRTRISITGHVGDLPEGISALFQSYGGNMLMALAVQGEVDCPGFIALLRTADMLWSDQEVVALQTAAAALSNTMARERLFEQVQQTLSETEALYRSSAALSEANTYQAILDVLLNHTVLGENSGDVTLQLFSSTWSETQIPEYAEVVAYWAREDRQHIRERYYVQEFPSSVPIIREGAPVFIEDVARDPILDRRARAMFSRALGAASLILLPLVVGGQRIGYIHATYLERQTFTEKSRRQLGNLAQQAAIAVLNILQLSATEARVHREQLIRQITSRIQEAPDVEGVLQTAIRELGRAFSTSRNRIQFQRPTQGADIADEVSE